jgi:hypothetical protein
MKKNILKGNNKVLKQSIISGTANSFFLKIAVDKLITYSTPKKIINYIESEKTKAIIGNPPFDVSEY